VDDTSRKKIVENFLEEERVCLLLTGLREPRHWSSAPKFVDIFDAKGEVLNLLEKFALDKTELISYPTSVGLADQSLHIEINGSYAGYLGGVRSDLLKVFGVEGEVYVAEIMLASLAEGRKKKYETLPRFPRVKRDLAFIVGVSTAEATVEEVIRKSSSNLVQRLELFDVYQGDKLPEGKKSLAFSLELMSFERTLTEEEIESEVRNIVKCVELTCGATWRTI
jgi:phenylalanyl-tRNA synthetase beta chain